MLVIHVTGAEELHRVAAVLRAEGSSPKVARDITRETHRGGPAIRAAFKAHAMAVLPKRGGLNAWVASSRMTFRQTHGALTGGMRVKVGRNSRSGRAELEGLDNGLVIHPFYGHSPWSSEGVVPESISEPILNEGERVLHAAVVVAGERLVARIEAAA